MGEGRGERGSVRNLANKVVTHPRGGPTSKTEGDLTSESGGVGLSCIMLEMEGENVRKIYNIKCGWCGCGLVVACFFHITIAFRKIHTCFNITLTLQNPQIFNFLNLLKVRFSIAYDLRLTRKLSRGLHLI